MKVDEWFDLTFHCPCCSKMLFIKVHVIEQEGKLRAIANLGYIEDMQKREE
jgi:hypothetical protein